MKSTRSSREEVGIYGGGKEKREYTNGFVTMAVECEITEEEVAEGGNVYFCFSFSSEPSLPHVSCGQYLLEHIKWKYLYNSTKFEGHELCL